MPSSSPMLTAPEVGASQETEYRLRLLESSIMLLAYEVVNRLSKQKIDTVDFRIDLEDLLQSILFTQQNYTPITSTSPASQQPEE